MADKTTEFPSVPPLKRQRSRWRWLLLIPALLVIALAGFVVWASTPWGVPMPETEAALISDDAVTVERERWLVFRPAGAEPKAALAFYPGAKVWVESYAPWARLLAEQGYLVALMPAPLNLALLDIDAAGDVIAAYPNVEHWAVGGHSLGGVAAASYARSQTGVDGLVLMASLPADTDSLADRDDLAVTFIYAANDGLFTPDEYDRARTLLPADTAYSEIVGGNHGQFGWYGDQSGDGAATISRENQQTQIVAATAALLERIATGMD